MQQIDHDDPRRPYVKVAASIRAAILNGELQPAERLPTTDELAELFGVAKLTVGSAVRLLRDEGYLTSRPGAGVWVSGQATLPVPADEPHPLAGTVAFLFEMGYLKNLPRAGWLRLGIPAPESVGDHSFRVGILGMVLASLEGADPGHVAAMCVLHDAHETRIGDVPAVGRAYITTAKPEVITGHQTAGMPDDMGKMFQDLTAEFEAAKTLEARVARDADKLETLLQAVEYGEQGYKTEAWMKTSIEALRTDSAKQLAQAINAADPAEWWSSFAASYHELRASSRGRSRS
jgi:5'-deoxynucleotidase YfbR-like HD superfamily hydrolase/DNA-binding transcriptional regulator YhcF (GntR family)